MAGESLLRDILSHPPSSSPNHGNESHMGFQPQLECSEEGFFDVDPADLDESRYSMRGTLQSIVSPQYLCRHRLYDESSQPHSSQQHAKFSKTNLSLPSGGNENLKVLYDNPCSLSSSSELSITSQKEKQPLESSRVSVESAGKSASSGGIRTSRKRIKWTEELHKNFVDCVKRLGGLKKATPKAILKLMGSEGLSILHVKSHLQKYRAQRYMPDEVQEDYHVKTSSSTSDTHVPRSISMQITKGLQMQLECQKHLCEQLKVQQNLQMLIEGQMKELERAFELQKHYENLHSANLDDASQDGPWDSEQFAAAN